MKKKKQIRSIVLFSMLFLACADSILYGIKHYENHQLIYGTYCTQNHGDSMYLVLEKDGTYLLYRQFEVLDSGKYDRSVSTKEFSVYTLVSKDMDKKLKMTADKKTIVLSELENSDVVMEKISDTSVYININEKGK